MKPEKTTERLKEPAEKIKEEVPGDKVLKIAYELLDLSLAILKDRAERGAKRKEGNHGAARMDERKHGNLGG